MLKNNHWDVRITDNKEGEKGNDWKHSTVQPRNEQDAQFEYISIIK